jgi:flagellar biosynthesis protein FlhG
MSDQADRLRQLVEASRAVNSSAASLLVDDVPPYDPRSSSHTRSLLFTSGKGGVGTSNIVLNLAIALADIGQEVLVVDADLGLANLDILCGLTPRYDLGDVLSGHCTLAEAIVTGPAGIKIIPGAHAIRVRAEALSGAAGRLVDELRELESASDFLLVDAGSGLGSGLKTLVAAADEAVIVTTPEPTSLADAHAAIARFRRLNAQPRLRVLVSQAGSVAEASQILEHLVASSRQFLGAVVTPLGPGFVSVDPHVPLAVRGRQPFMTAFPNAPASRSLRRMAQALVRENRPRTRQRRAGFFSGMAARWAFRIVNGARAVSSP